MITLTNEYLEGPKARSIPGAYYSRECRAWVLDDPTPRAAAVALRLFPGLSMEHPELSDIRAELAQEIRPFDNAQKYNRPIRAARVRAQLKLEGHDLYQFQAIDLGYVDAILETHGAAYLGWERGLGKSVGAAALIDELGAKRILIVAPNTAKRAVWEPELRRLCPWLEVVVLRNSKSQRERDLGYVKQLLSIKSPVALVVHYEALDIVAKLRANNRGWDTIGTWDIVIADEAHRIANPKTKMAKALKRIPTKHKLALSGSIIQNHAEELFSPLQWLFPDRYKSAWRDWNNRFLDYVEGGWGGTKVCVGVKIERLDDMRQELGVYMTYRTKADELDLPERTDQTLFVELSASQRKAYDTLRDTCIAELDDGTIIRATDGLVLLGRLRQVATGLDLLSGEISDSSKSDLAMDLITDSDGATVVFSWYRAAAYSLAARLTAANVPCFVVTGDTPPNTRADYIKRFQAGEGKVFIGTLGTLSESVTLHRASNAILLDKSWNPSVNDQACDRIYRIGQDKPVTITSIVAKDTVDELRVQPVLADKTMLRNLILGSS